MWHMCDCKTQGFADPDKIALLDNFCMGNPEEPTELGRIVECAKGIREAALAYGAPYVSGKDSFYNYFETEDGPVNIPVTFLCSGFGVVEDATHVRGASLRPHIYLIARWLCKCPAFRAMQDICVICYLSTCYVAHVRL